MERLRVPLTTNSARWKRGTQKNVKTTLKTTMRFGRASLRPMLVNEETEENPKCKSQIALWKKFPKEFEFLYEKYYQSSAKALPWVTMCTHACGRWGFWRYFPYPLPTLFMFPGRGAPYGWNVIFLSLQKKQNVPAPPCPVEVGPISLKTGKSL